MLISVVIPCYNSEASLEKVVCLLNEQFSSFESYDCEIILVNDHSRDGTYAKIKELCASNENVRGIDLMRNFGQHNALMAAMNFASGDLILGMDDDLQTHPSQIYKIISKMEEGYDLVYGIYENSKNGFMKNLSSAINRVTSRILLGRPKEIVSSNFWIIKKAVKDEVIKYTGCNPYVDGVFYRVTSNIGNVTVEHFKREIGSSNYTLKKLIKLWLAYWNFSVIPLRIASVLGCVSACLGVIFAISIVVRKIMTPGITVGWASIMSAMTFFFGLVLMVLGIIGEYLGKVLMALNGTPQYIVRDTVGFATDTLPK